MATQASYVEPYQAPPGVGRFAGTRVGDNTDILVFYDGTSQEISEYVRGFLFLGYFFLVLYTIWSVTLCVCMCCGKERLGFWSGRPFRNRTRVNSGTGTPTQQDGTDHMEEEEHQQNPVNNSQSSYHGNKSCCNTVEPLCSIPNIVRIVFITLATLTSILIILFATKGLQAMQQGTVEVYDKNIGAVLNLAKQGRQLLNQGSVAVTTSADLIRTALDRESVPNTFCPADPDLTQSAAARDAFAQIADAQQVLDYLQDYNDEHIANVNSVLDDFQEDLREAETELDRVDVFNAGAMVALALYLVLCVAFVAATLLAMYGKEICLLTKTLQWIGMPLFILLTVINLLWIVVLPIAGGINGDFCQPAGEGSSPDELVLEVLQREGYQPGNYRYDAVQYFIQYQCQEGRDPYEPLLEYLQELRDSQESLSGLLGTIRDNNEIALYCDRSFDLLTTELQDLDQLINILRSTAQEFMDLVNCPNLVPIYTSSVYDASCTNSTEAIFWLYMTAFFLALFGYIMITLRAAYRVSSVDGNGEDYRDYAADDLKLDPADTPTKPIYPPYFKSPFSQEEESVASQTPAQHMSHPLATTSSVSPLPVPSRVTEPKGNRHYYQADDDGFDC